MWRSAAGGSSRSGDGVDEELAAQRVRPSVERRTLETGAAEATRICPAGRALSLLSADDRMGRPTQIHHLVQDDGVPPGEIAILAPL